MVNRTALQTCRSACSACRSSLTAASITPLRTFSSSTRVLAFQPKTPKSMDDTLANVDASFSRANPFGSVIPARGEHPRYQNLVEGEWPTDERHHLHIYAHKHNTHITLTKPNRDAIISVSCGNIGFRKAGRGSYDAAYQLAAFVMSRIQDKGLLGGRNAIKEVELVYRGFGPGREAVTKAILGNEGKLFRPLINKLSDSTRLKFGGTRSKKPRRLG